MNEREREREKRNIEATSSGEKVVEKIPRRFDRSTVKMERKQNACSTNFYESSLFRLISRIGDLLETSSSLQTLESTRVASSSSLRDWSSSNSLFHSRPQHHVVLMNRSCLSNFLTDVEKQGRGVEVWCRVASIRLGDSFFFFSFREERAQESNIRTFESVRGQRERSTFFFFAEERRTYYTPSSPD